MNLKTINNRLRARARLLRVTRLFTAKQHDDRNSIQSKFTICFSLVGKVGS